MADSRRSELLVTDEVKNEFKAIKTRRKYRYVILRADEDTFELHVESTGSPEATAQDFADALSKDEPRYALFDHSLKTRDGRLKETLYFVTWAPVTSQGREKILYSSQKLHVRGSLSGTSELQASSKEGLLRVLGVTEEGGSAAVEEEEDDDEWDPDS